MAAVPAYWRGARGSCPARSKPRPSRPAAPPRRPHAVATARLARGAARPRRPTTPRIYWEQRDRSAAVAGLWYYDVRTRRHRARCSGATRPASPAGSRRRRRPRRVGAWAGRRGDGPAAIQAYDLETRTAGVAPGGPRPARRRRTRVLGRAGRRGRGKDVIRGSNALTDEEYASRPAATSEELRRLGSPGRSGSRGRAPPARSGPAPSGSATRYRLAATGTAVAIDRDRVLWAAAAGRHSTASSPGTAARAAPRCCAGSAGHGVVPLAEPPHRRVGRRPQGHRSPGLGLRLRAGKATPVSDGRRPSGEPGDRRRQRVLGRRPQRALGAVRQIAAASDRPAPADPATGRPRSSCRLRRGVRARPPTGRACHGRHRGRASDQALRQEGPRRRRRELHHRAGHHHRRPRPQRRRQDHHPAHDPRPRAADGRER